MIRRLGRLLIAVVVLIGGILALMLNLNVFPGMDLKAVAAQWWPLILVVIGIIMLFEYLIDYRGGNNTNQGGNGLF